MDNPSLTDGEYVMRTHNAEDLPDAVNVRDLATGGLITKQGPIAASTDCAIPCPWCSNPQGWDACPIHPSPPPTHAQS